MKTITLHTAVVDNAGTRIEAGAQVAVGTGPDEITLLRAKALTEGGSAVEVSAAKRNPSKHPAQPKHTSDEAK